MAITKNEAIIKEFDVLCGRGGLSNNHPGNRLFRRIIKENKDIYQELSENSTRKHMLVSSIIKAIEQHGGRFLRKAGKEDKWLEISHKQACAKTSQALREQDPPACATNDSFVSGNSPSPLHSKFRQALRTKGALPPRAVSPCSSISTCTPDLSRSSLNDINTVNGDDDDDIPELANEVLEFDALIGDIADIIEGYDNDENDDFTPLPLAPNELLIFDNAADFGTLFSDHGGATLVQ